MSVYPLQGEGAEKTEISLAGDNSGTEKLVAPRKIVQMSFRVPRARERTVSWWTFIGVRITFGRNQIVQEC